jgi:hypothetical protein
MRVGFIVISGLGSANLGHGHELDLRRRQIASERSQLRVIRSSSELAAIAASLVLCPGPRRS